MNFTIIGEVCIDNNEVEGAKYEFPGGPSLYVPLAIKNFPEINIQIINNYGADLLPFNLPAQKYFVSKEPNIEKTLRYRNIVKDNKRTQYAENYKNEKFNIDEETMNKVLSESDVVFFATLTPYYSAEYVKSLMSKVKKDAVKIFLPQGYFRKFDENGLKLFREFEEEELIGLFDFLILSDEDYPNVLELSKAWANQYKNNIIVTRGKDGADVYYGVEWFNESQEINIPTKPVDNIKDSTGSGEIFSGSFGYMFTKTRDTLKSINFANKIAGICLAYTPDQIEGLDFEEFN